MKKIIGIFILMLFVGTAVLPAIGTMNEENHQFNDTLYQPFVEWEKTYGRDEFDHFHSARQTIDGGYIACGVTEESDEYFAWLLKVDSNGNEEWSKINHDINGTIFTSTEHNIMVPDVTETSDGGFLVCGFSMIFWEYQEISYWISTGFFWKTDSMGNTEWVKRYYDENFDEQVLGFYRLYNVIEVGDSFVSSGYIVYYSAEGVQVELNGTIIKTDLSGNLLWSKDYDNNIEKDYLLSIDQTSDNGYFLGGYVGSEEYQGDSALWMVKTDENGNLIWDQIFDGPGFEYTAGKGFHQTSDGGYIMNGVSDSYGHGGTDIWVIKTDSSGNEVWNKTFGGTRNDYCWGMCKADNNGFALGICLNHGYIGGTKDDILVIEADEDGNIEWELQLEEAGVQVTRSINPTKDGGYILSAMTTTQLGDSDSDGILVKIASSNNQQPSKPVINGEHKGKPNTKYTFTVSSTDPDGDSLTYMWDWGDGNYSDWLETSEASHTWTTEDNFKIRVMAKDIHGGESEWSDPFAFSTPKNKATVYQILIEFFEKLIYRFPFLGKILNQILL